MKNTIIKMAVGIVFLLSACEKEKIDVYTSDESKVYFQVQNFSGNNGAVGYATTTSFSFVDYSSEWKSVTFKGNIQILGRIKDYDRPVKVVVDEENTTMVEGRDFVANLDTVKIKARENNVGVAIQFLRSTALRDSVLTLVLKLEANEHFRVLEAYKESNVWNNTAADTLDGSRYTFKIGEVYTQPGAWTSSNPNAQAYFGDWSVDKFIFVNEYFGFTAQEWQYGGTGKLITGRMAYYARKLQKELQDRADAGNPVMDGGAPMQLAEAYKVNYSNVGQ